MPVKIFVGRDIQKFTHYPDASHEARGVRHICDYLWDVWHHQSSRHYAIVANPKQTKTGRELSADLVIISELGLGVIDLKESYDEIKCGQPDKAWYAGPLPMKAGADNGYINPHKQVQAYAAAIRDDLIDTNSFPGDSWEWEDFKVHTAVCFTNPLAQIEKCQKTVKMKWWRDEALEDWEEFAVLSAEDVRDWGADLRFDVDMGRTQGFRQYSWSPQEVYALATDFFAARPWLEMQAAMPEGRPLAYLTVLEDEQPVQLFNISQEVAKIGRAPESHVVIPVEYETVSRHHAIITRTIDGFELEDKSKNGTYVNNRQLDEGQKYLLQEDDRIMLGGLKADQTICCLKFSRQAPPPLSTTYRNLTTID